MKKMKIFGFLASVLALSACSLAASKVTAKEFKDLYDQNLKATRIESFASIKKGYSVKDSIRTIGEEEEGKYSGKKFTTSYLQETVYTVNLLEYDLVNKIDNLIESTVNVTLGLTVTYKECKFQEVPPADESIKDIKKEDVTLDGEKIEYAFLYQPNKTLVEKATVVVYRTNYSWNAEKGEYKKGKTERFVTLNNINKYEQKADIVAAVNAFFTNEEIKAVFDVVRGLYNQSLDFIEFTCKADDANNELEIFSTNSGYSYRHALKEDGKIVLITEIGVANKAAEAKEAESSASSEEASEVSSEEEITEEETSEEESSEETSSEPAPVISGYRVKNMVQREGVDGKVIHTLTYTGI